jgi:hypothetical protein
MQAVIGVNNRQIMIENSLYNNEITSADTNGGAYIGGNVDCKQDFVGRDKIINNNYYQAPSLPLAQCAYTDEYLEIDRKLFLGWYNESCVKRRGPLSSG